MNPEEQRKTFATEGFKRIGDTAVHRAPIGFKFYGILVQTEAVIDTHKTAGCDDNEISGDTLPVGMWLPGEWSEIKLSSGVVYAFQTRLV